MKGRYTQHSKVMTIANNLVKQGYSRAYAMVKAWALVKLSRVTVKVVGVTYGKRHCTRQGSLYYGLSSESIFGVYRAADGQRQAYRQPVGVYLRRSGALSQLWNENRGEGIGIK